MNDLLNVALFLAVLVAAAWIAWRRGARMIAVVVGLFALLPALTLLRELPWPGYLVVVAVLAVFGWHRSARSAGVVARWSAGNRRRSGVASTLDITRTASATAMRRRATTVRPSLGELSRWELQRLPVGEVGLQLCRSGVTRVYASPEDVVTIVGGPRVGKTGLIASMVLDFPGAAVVTSTRTDLLSICGPLRAKRGPVYVFNAVGLGDIDSTITFDPLTGCTDPVAAVERATDLLAATSRGGSGDREFWDAQARRVLAALLHAAALGHKTMADVLSWVAKPDQAAQDVPALLRRSGVAAFVSDVEQFVGTNDRTRTSITSTVMPALGWLTHPAAAAAAQPGAGFDVEELLRQSGDGVPARRRGNPGRPAGLRADRAHRPRSPPPGRRPPRRTPRPAAGAVLGRGRADLPGPAGVLDRGHGRARGDDLRRVPVPRAAAGPLGRAQRRRDLEQHRCRGHVRRHPRPRRPAVLVHPGRGARRVDHHHRPARPGRVPHDPAGAGGAARRRSRTCPPGGCWSSAAPCRRCWGGPGWPGTASTSPPTSGPTPSPSAPGCCSPAPGGPCCGGSADMLPSSRVRWWRCGRAHPLPPRSRRAGAAGPRSPPPQRSAG